MTPKPYQLETNENGALDLACQRAKPYVDAARANTTRAAYARRWARWEAWCALMHTVPLPAAPAAVAAYLGELAREGKSVATIKGALAAIQFVHREGGYTLSRDNRAIAAVLAGITRTSSRPIQHAAALELDALRALIASIDGDDVRALRDRALLLVGFFGALRRSELVGLDVTVGKAGGRSGLEICAHGLRVHLSASKGSAATQTIAIPRRADALCATAAVERYLAAAALTQGPLFRAVSRAGRVLARRLDAASVRHILKARSSPKFSPHSLRSGFITSAAKAQVPEHLIQKVSRHASVEVLRSYIRAGEDFTDGAAARL